MHWYCIECSQDVKGIFRCMQDLKARVHGGFGGRSEQIHQDGSQEGGSLDVYQEARDDDGNGEVDEIHEEMESANVVLEVHQETRVDEGALATVEAFDTVRHQTLLAKFSDLPIPDCTYNWLLEYFSKRRHCTRVMDIISGFLVINASIVQGSSIGPVSYVINASDLRTICLMNKLFKYADDTYLVVPASKSDTIESELQSIASWSESNNLTLNTKKSTEIVIYKPKSKNANLPPPPVPGIQRVSQMVVLGVTIHDRLSFKPHIENLISRCAQTFYALRVLKSQGLNGIALWDVGQAILNNRLLYASPVWWGFTDASDKQRLQAVITRAQRLGFLSPSTRPLSELCGQADDTLFSAGPPRKNPGPWAEAVTGPLI